MRYVISDLHLGHKNIHKHRIMAGFNSPEDHWEAGIEGLSKIPKGATLFLLGDIAFDKIWLDKVKSVLCKNKVLIMGNHCQDGKDVGLLELYDSYQKVYSLHKYKRHWMSHCPLHNQELRGLRNMHGHTHYNCILGDDGELDSNYINCCVEYTTYDPISFEYATSEEYTQECIRLYSRYKDRGLI